MNVLTIAIALMLSSAAVTDQSAAVQPRRGKGLLIGAAVAGGIGVVGAGVSALVLIGPGSATHGGGWFGPSYDLGLRAASFVGMIVGGSLMLMAAVMIAVGLAKWRSSAPPEPPTENLRLTAFTPRRAPVAPLLMVNVARF